MEQQTWNLLIIDDEPAVHQVLELVLGGFEFDAKSLSLHHAYSEEETKAKLEAIEDLAVILLDVVMEAQHSGLELVRYIREELGNKTVRIILLTGQPGLVPSWEVITRYEINDYRLKTELTRERLFIALAAALRSYTQLCVLADLAVHDKLTGLANRHLFDILLAQAIHRTARGPSIGALVLLDLDNFKEVNDNFGHLIGDKLLQALADRLLRVSRSGEIIARVGGDELGIVVSGLDCEDDIHSLISRLMAATEEPFDIDGKWIHQTISVGVSFFSDESLRQEEIIDLSDRAMYQAKNGGKNMYQVLWTEK